MEESHHLHHHQPSSRLGLKSAGGEIVEVQGGHIVRSTGRKDRHSKVCTAKGPRDRRVRLSAHTAIQFYDVQDRLGFDRPSKAVDWLIKKAKSAIDELAELPAWHPTGTVPNMAQTEQGPESENRSLQHLRPMGEEQSASGYGFEHHQQLNNSSSFLPPSLDSDSIADTIKSFFPTTATTQSSSIHFQNYSNDLLSRTNSQAQDLRLSLQSLQDPILLHHHHHSTPTPSAQQQALFSGTSPLAFDTNSANWPEQQQESPEMGRFQRMVAWNSGAESTGGGFFFNSPPLLVQPLLGQNPLFSQRGPLQSSNSPSVRAWMDQPIATVDSSSISGIGFASGGFSGFRIPARIQGEEEQDAVSNKPSSASSASRH